MKNMLTRHLQTRHANLRLEGLGGVQSSNPGVRKKRVPKLKRQLHPTISLLTRKYTQLVPQQRPQTKRQRKAAKGEGHRILLQQSLMPVDGEVLGPARDVEQKMSSQRGRQSKL
jgi:hypothetical protein